MNIKTIILAALPVAAFTHVEAAAVELATSADISSQCYAVGDTVTITGGDAAAVLGDGVATLASQTLMLSHAGFTLLKDSGGTEYYFGVYEAPGGEGDVFFFDWTENSNYNWDTAPWTKITQNSDRTYPNHADDVAMVRVARSSYGYLTVPAAGVTVGQLVVGMLTNWTLDHTSGTVTPFRFERTDGETPRWSVSRPISTGNGTFQLRVGEWDRDNSGNVLDVSFVGKAMEIDLCGDSAAAASYCRLGAICFGVGRSKFEIGAGQTLRVVNGTLNTGSNTDYFDIHGRLGSGVFGAGTLEMRDVCLNCQLTDPDTFFDVGLYRAVPGWGPFSLKNNVVANNTSRFTTRFNTLPSVPMEVLSARCPTNLNAQTTFQNYWVTGVANAWLSPSVLLSGCNYQFVQNGEYAPHGDYYDTTNIADKVTLRGHVGFYSSPSYNRDGHTDSDGVQRGRVSHHIRLKEIELFDRWSTAQANGFNFCRNDANTNDIKGTLTIDNWRDYVRRPAGVDPADYDGNVYAIIPWMTVHANDNNQYLTDTDWGQEQTFPGVREEDGCLRLFLHLSNRGTGTLANRSPTDNFYFADKGGFSLNGADRTVFSLVYCTLETPPYAAGGNFYLDTSKGGHKLTVSSGAMAITRNNKWLGQPADMTRNGKIVLEGDPSYLHVPSTGVYGPASGSNAIDYNMCWVPLVAEHDLVKGGAGSVGLAGDQRGVQGVLAVNGGELWLGYPAHKKNGYLYTYGHENKGWPMHGCATDCDFVVRGGAVLALASAGYQGVDSDGNEVDAPVLANGKDKQHTITLERSGLAVGGIYVAEGVQGVVHKLYVEDEDGTAVTLARGTWGSSASAAENVDDELFAGPGVLKVEKDDLANGMMIFIR